jgi:hypothetical protein
MIIPLEYLGAFMSGIVGLLSLIGVYVALRERLVKLETKVEGHEKKHDNLDTTIAQINQNLSDIKSLIIDKLEKQ